MQYNNSEAHTGHSSEYPSEEGTDDLQTNHQQTFNALEDPSQLYNETP
jgi:hypothetical protein